MKPFKCSVSQTTTHRKEYKIVTNPAYTDWYWDEGIHFYHAKGWRRKWNKKRHLLQKWQVRMYRSWKHNRKTQYKH